MEVKDGEVVVIRDDDAVVCIFYREFYDDVIEFIDEVNMYIAAKKLDKPNFSFMMVEDNCFVPLKDAQSTFAIEFFKAALKFKVEQYYCEKCDTLLFIYTDYVGYCPNCKEVCS